MVQISGNTLGVDFQRVTTIPDFKTGTTEFGTDGGTYQYAKASASISADTSVANITLSSGEYVAAASGGGSTSPGVDVASGSYAWFKLGEAA